VRYLICAVLGIAITVAAVVLVTSGTYAIAQAGNCASGGPYVIANECPDGLEVDIFKLVGGIFAVIAGVGVFGARGAPGGRSGLSSGLTGAVVHRGGGTASLAVAAWGMMWIGIAGAIWYSANGDNAPPSANEAVTITLTIVFGAMGLIPLIGVVLGIAVGRRPGTAVPTIGAGTVGAPAGGADLAELVRQAQEIARRQRASGGSTMSAGDAQGDSPVKEPPTPGT
jgi:hypothetical protein